MGIKRLLTQMLLVGTALSLLVNGHSLTKAAYGAPSNKELKIGLTQEFENLNPLLSSMLATSWIYYNTRRILLQYDKEGNWEESLVVKRPTLKNGLAKLTEKDGKKILTAEWEIKPEAVWADGTPITGHDLQLGVDVATNPNIAIPDRSFYENIDKIDIDPRNPKKFTITYKKAKWTFNRVDALWELLPSHIEGPIYEKYKDAKQGYEKNTTFVKNPSHKGIYNGPYVVKELKLGSHIVLERNKNWWGKQKPAIEKITLVLIPNTATLEANLRSNTIDMISVLGFTFDQALAFEKKVKAEKLPYEVMYKPSAVYEHIDLKMDNPILSDINVRKALVYGIDRGRLVKSLFEDKQPAAIHNLVRIDPWYTDDPSKIVLYPHSRRKAKKLLEKAGWKLQQDGYRYKDGKKLEMQIMTTAGNKVRELVQTYLQDQWKKVGIAITIKNEPARVFFGETTNKRKFPHMAMYAWSSRPETPPITTMHSNSIPTKENSYSGQNQPGWVNKEVDSLLDQLEGEFDDAKRTEIMHKILYHYTNEVPVIPLYYRSNVVVVPKSLEGFHMSNTQDPNTQFVEYWHFGEATAKR